MATSTVLLKTTVTGEFEVASLPKAFMSSSYPVSGMATTGQRIEPGTVYTKNTVTVANNIRSLNERFGYPTQTESQENPQIVNGVTNFAWNNYLTDFVNIGNQSTAFLLQDFAPQQGLKDYVSLDGTVIFEWQQGGGNTGIIAPPVKRYANFQNRLLFLRGNGAELLEYPLHPDSEPDESDSNGDYNQIAEVVGVGTARQWRIYELSGMNLLTPEGPIAEVPDQTRIHGCVTAGNYLVLYNTRRLFWSSPLEFNEFTPTIGLAGSVSVTGAKGAIINCVPNPQGFTIYCVGNIIHAALTGDSAVPFTFSVVEGAGALVSATSKLLMASDNFTGTQIAFTSKGLQLIDGPYAQSVPEKITRYLADLSMELYDDTTGDVRFEVVDSDNGLIAEKVKRIDIYQNNLFFHLISDNQSSPNMVVVFNTETQAISRWYGRIMLVYPVLHDTKAGMSNLPLGWQYQRNIHPLKLWLVTFAINGTVVTPTARIVDLADSRCDCPILNPSEYEPSVVLTELGISPDIEVEIHSIKLQGINGLNGTNRATIRVFTDVFSANPVTFQYHEATDRYYGYICGRNPRVEITGRKFLLSTIEVEISRGANL